MEKVYLERCYLAKYSLKPIGEKLKILLKEGDIYFMSEKAVGTDWKKKKHSNFKACSWCEKIYKVLLNIRGIIYIKNIHEIIY